MGIGGTGYPVQRKQEAQQLIIVMYKKGIQEGFK